MSRTTHAITLFLLTCILAHCLSSCTHLYPSKKIIIAASSDVEFPLKEIAAKFERQTHITIDIILGASGQLSAQIANGAPFDLFLSGDLSYAEQLHEAGLTPQAPKVFAQGKLILWSMREDLRPRSFNDFITGEQIQKIAMANPEFASYGKAARQFLTNLKLPQLEDKIIMGDDLVRTNQFITEQKVDVGITGKAIVYAPAYSTSGYWMEIDPKYYEPILQAAVLLPQGEKPPSSSAKLFYNYLFSEEAQQIFRNYGYNVER